MTREVQIVPNLTKTIQLDIPIISGAMDSLTELSLAIAMARVGVIVIFHKNMTIENKMRNCE